MQIVIAKITCVLVFSDHTTIQRRLRERQGVGRRGRSRRSMLERSLKPVAGLDADGLLGMTEASYIELVQWTGEQARADKRGKLRRQEQSNPPAAVWSLADSPQQWVGQVQGTESQYYRVIGSAEALMAKAAELGQTWIGTSLIHDVFYCNASRHHIWWLSLGRGSSTYRRVRLRTARSRKPPSAASGGLS